MAKKPIATSSGKPAAPSTKRLSDKPGAAAAPNQPAVAATAENAALAKEVPKAAGQDAGKLITPKAIADGAVTTEPAQSEGEPHSESTVTPEPVVAPVDLQRTASATKVSKANSAKPAALVSPVPQVGVAAESMSAVEASPAAAPAKPSRSSGAAKPARKPAGGKGKETQPVPSEAECLADIPALPKEEAEAAAPPMEFKAPAEPMNLPPLAELEPQPDWDSTQLMSEPTWEPPAEPEPQHPPQEWSPPPQPSLYIVQITPELAPVAKVGGLADVVFGLSNELEIRGNSVEIILPKYDCLRYDHIWGLCETYRDLWVPWFGGAIHCTVFFGFVHGRKCFFIEPHSGDNYFNRGCVYGFNDDVMRFAFFTRAAMEFLLQSGKRPDIIHCHDWQTALAPVLLYEIYQHLGMGHSRVCFTIHNFKHQGVTGAQVLHATGLNRPDYYFHYDRLRDNHNATAINLMKGGVVYSNFVTTVSPRHAYEAKDQGQGFGLESTLHIHHGKYGGVVNGIDYGFWNPEIDPHIPVHYSVDSIDGKYENKRALRHRLMLADNQKPIVAFVGRLDPQKGLELIRHAIFYTLARGGQFVLLGSSPDGQINSHFWGLKHHLNDHPDVHIEVGYNEELSHLIYAGADMVLVPSRFEPCGLTQLIALRYGTVPVVREVGGLADTVVDKDFSSRPLHERTGYVFRDYDGAGLESALGRAISCYYEFPEHFRELMKNAMRADYSWKNPGQDYLNIYHLIRNR